MNVDETGMSTIVINDIIGYVYRDLYPDIVGETTGRVCVVK